jgi:hypothetical protein
MRTTNGKEDTRNGKTHGRIRKRETRKKAKIHEHMKKGGRICSYALHENERKHINYI